MLYSIVLFFSAFLFFTYLLFIRTEQLRSKLIRKLNSFQVIEDNGVLNNKSKYLETNDPRPRLVMRNNQSEVMLLTCSTHGQLKNIYLICLVVDDTFNNPGFYGKGRGYGVLRAKKIAIDLYPKDEYINKTLDINLFKNAQFIEVIEGKAYLFYSVSSFWGTSALDVIAGIER